MDCGDHDQVRLRAELAAQKKVIEDANAQERERTKTLQQSLAQIEELKQKARSPVDIVRGINQALDLPKPICSDPKLLTSRLAVWINILLRITTLRQ